MLEEFSKEAHGLVWLEFAWVTNCDESRSYASVRSWITPNVVTMERASLARDAWVRAAKWSACEFPSFLNKPDDAIPTTVAPDWFVWLQYV